MIKQEEVKKIEEGLETEASLLRKQIAKHETVKDFGNDTEGSDLSEEADQAEDESNQIAMAQALKVRLEEVENAINNIKAGKFGHCANCGAEIGSEKLMHSPTMSLCSDCADKA